MSLREGEEGLVRAGAVGEVAAQHALHRGRRIFGLYIAKDLSPKRGIRPEAAAHQDVIALYRFLILGHFHLAGEQPDLADEMLRAGMVTAGEVDVDRRIERNAGLAPARDFFGVPLGIAGGEFAAGIAGAGDEARA